MFRVKVNSSWERNKIFRKIRVTVYREYKEWPVRTRVGEKEIRP
jgi:hypothetical protein